MPCARGSFPVAQVVVILSANEQGLEHGSLAASDGSKRHAIDGSIRTDCAGG